MTPENEYRLGRTTYHRNQEESLEFVLVLIVLVLFAAGSYILVTRFHLRPAQLVEGGLYLLFASIGCISVAWYVITLPRRRETTWPHPPLYIPPERDRKAVQTAYNQNAIVLGYDVHRKPWLWPDATRVMQSVVFGATGSGKTTLLKNIITQDLFRLVGQANDGAVYRCSYSTARVTRSSFLICSRPLKLPAECTNSEC
jgi:hypothetical protein